VNADSNRDWSYCFRYGRPITVPGCKTLFNSCLGRPHITDGRAADFTTLPVKGKAIRKITWLAPQNFDHLYYRDGIKHFLDIDGHTGVLRQHFIFQQGFSDDRIDERWPNLTGQVLRILLADGAFGTVQPLPETVEKLERILGDENEIMDMKRKMDAGEYVLNQKKWEDDYTLLKKLFEWALIAQKKVMFVTKAAKGVGGPDSIHLGLAACVVQVDDIIAVLHGSQVPVVLRPAESGDNQWRVISQCYLEGWMYRNDVEKKIWWEEDESDTFLLV
jgi:hypothetical protein